MKRQKCDRQTPCSRCIQNKEPHLCTTEWTNGYNPAVHRKYPRKPLTATPSQNPAGETNGGMLPQDSPQTWPSSSTSSLGLPLHLRSELSERPPAPALESHHQSKLLNPSSNNVDFITYGRSDVTDISMDTLLREKEPDTWDQALMNKNLNQDRTETSMDDASTNSFSPAAKSAEINHLQSLLPSKRQVLLLSDYHGRCMSYWTGGI